MRLVFVLASFVSLILASRWLTLSEDSPFADRANVVAESVGDQQIKLNPSISKNEMATQDEATTFVPVAVGSLLDSQSDLPIIRPLPPTTSTFVDPEFDTDASSVPSSTHENRSERSYVGKAKNVKRLVRAEYEISSSTAESLSQLESDSILETSIINTDSDEIVILQVTSDEQTQNAISQLIDAISPNSKSVRKRQNVKTRRTIKYSSVPQKTVR